MNGKTLGHKRAKSRPTIQGDDSLARLAKVLRDQIRARSGVDLDADDPAIVSMEATVFAAQEAGAVIRREVESTVERFEGLLVTAASQRAQHEREAFLATRALLAGAADAISTKVESRILTGAVSQRLEDSYGEFARLVDHRLSRVHLAFAMFGGATVIAHILLLAFTRGVFS